MNIKNIIKKFQASINNNVKITVYSVIFAIIVWFIVSITVYPNAQPYLNDVRINIDLTGTSAERSDLSLVSQDIENVTVQIEGNRAVIGNLKSSDLVANAVIENVTAAGEYQLALNVTSESGKEFDVLNIRPSTVTVKLDKYITQSFAVEAEAPNVNAIEGYMKGDPIASPNSVSIMGPEEQIKKITRCVVRTDYGKDGTTLKESYEVTSGNELILYNDSTVLETNNLKIDQTNFSISIPIYMKKTLEFKFTFSNVPSGFPIEDLKYTADAVSIDVAAPYGTIEKIDDFNLGYIDMRTVDIGTVLQFPVNLPESYQNLSGIQNVTLTFDGAGLVKRKINISNKNISIINAPAQFDIGTITTGWDVTFIGPEDVVKALTAQDVVSQIDLLGINIKSGEYVNVPITFIVANKGCVWAFNSYTATVRAKDK